MMEFNLNSQSLFGNFLQQRRESAEIYQPFSYKTHRLVWSTDADDAKMLLDIPPPMNYVIIGKLALNSVNIRFYNKLKALCKSLLCFAKLGRLTTQKWPKFGL